MAELSNDDLILLDNLIYLNSFATETEIRFVNSVNSLKNGVLDDSAKIKEKTGQLSYPAEITRDRWVQQLVAAYLDGGNNVIMCGTSYKGHDNGAAARQRNTECKEGAP